jgi:hypothetical protein
MLAFQFSLDHLVKELFFVFLSILSHNLVIKLLNFCFYFGINHLFFIHWNRLFETFSQFLLKYYHLFSITWFRASFSVSVFFNSLVKVKVGPFMRAKVKSKLASIQAQWLISLSVLVLLHLLVDMVTKPWQNVLLDFYLGFHVPK